MPYYGRRVTAGDTDMGDIGASTQVASVYNKATTNGWATKVGMWGGKASSTNPTYKLAVWNTNDAKNPTDLIFSHAGVTVSVAQSYGGDGASYEVPCSFKVEANKRYAIGAVATGADGHYAMVQASRNASADNQLQYRKFSLTSPANPNGYTYSSYEGWLSAWIEYTANRAPSVTTNAPNGWVTAIAPTFMATFSDPDTALGDKLTAYRIQVVRVSDNAVMWDSGTLAATTTEKNSGDISRTYGGTALTPNVDYTWRIQVADSFSTWSEWSPSVPFSINGGGSFSLFSPTGRVTSKQPTPFTAKWSHANSYNMSTVQVRIRQAGAIVLTSGEVAKSVANNATVSATWSELFSTASLNYGIAYQWEIRGKDATNNLWSAWSPLQEMTVNGAPTVPANLTPTENNAFTTRPKLQCKVTDPDDDSLIVTARITRVSTSTSITATMNDVGDGVYEFQTTATELPAYDSYTWSAISYDGSLYSGEVTSSGSAARSAENAFAYAQGPTVTLLTPTPNQVFVNQWPVATWNAIANLKQWRLTFRKGGMVIRTGWSTSSATSASIPGSQFLRSGDTATVQLEAEDNNGLFGYSDVVTFGVTWNLPSVVGVQASPEYMAFDPEPSAVRLTWAEMPPFTIGATVGQFQHYLVWRRMTGSAFESAELVGKITGSTTTSFVDFTPLSGVDYTYSLQQVQIFSLDTLASDPVDVQAQINLAGVVLQDVMQTHHVLLTYQPDRKFDYHNDMVTQQVWGRTAPVFVYGTTRYQTVSGTFLVVSDDNATAGNHINSLRDLWDSNVMVCYRDDRGRKFFGHITSFSEQDEQPSNYRVSMTLTETNYVEGMA